MRRRFHLVVLGACAALMLASGAAMHTTELSAQEGVRPAWPPAPAQARIRFMRSISPGSVRKRPSALSRVLRAIVGLGTSTPDMAQPYGVAVGRDGRVYVADTAGGRIHVYDVQRERYSSIDVRGTSSLVGIGLVGDRILVTDSASGRLLCLTSSGDTAWTLGPKDGFERPTGLAASADRVYVVDTLAHQVVVVDITGHILERFGTRGNEPGQFNFPTNIARAQDGTLYVTDAMNFRVQVFDRRHRFVRAFGQLGDGSGDFTKPKGIALDADGHVYVVEGLNDVVQIFDTEGRLLLAFGGSGIADGQLWLPTGIAIANDTVYVVDAANHRVQTYQYLRAQG